MQAARMFAIEPGEELILAGPFRLARPGRPIATDELAGVLGAVNGARFQGLLAIEIIARLGCVEVRAGGEFTREFWPAEDGVRYFPHRDDGALATWLLHQLGHRAAEVLGADIEFDGARFAPFFHRSFPTPRDFIERAPECAGLRHLWARLGAGHRLGASLSALPAEVRRSLASRAA